MFAFMPMLAYMPGFQIGTDDDIKNANFPFIMFVTACMSIGATAGSLEIGQMISNTALPMLEGFEFGYQSRGYVADNLPRI